MNLQTIQKRVEEMSAELLTLSNDIAHLISGDVVRERAGFVFPVVDRKSDWAKDMRAGDKVMCISIDFGNSVRERSFTLGNTYTVERRLRGDVGQYFYGVRILEDNENQGHDAGGCVFVKVEG